MMTITITNGRSARQVTFMLESNIRLEVSDLVTRFIAHDVSAFESRTFPISIFALDGYKLIAFAALRNADTFAFEQEVAEFLFTRAFGSNAWNDVPFLASLLEEVEQSKQEGPTFVDMLRERIASLACAKGSLTV
jgi:hypothetical protein